MYVGSLARKQVIRWEQGNLLCVLLTFDVTYIYLKGIESVFTSAPETSGNPNYTKLISFSCTTCTKDVTVTECKYYVECKYYWMW